MRSIIQTPARPVSSHFKGWVYGVVIWLLLVELVASAYVIGAMSLGTLVFGEVCTLAAGAIALIVRNRLNRPPEIVEQILYRTEHQPRMKES